jgi:hypothetical protein
VKEKLRKAIYDASETRVIIVLLVVLFLCGRRSFHQHAIRFFKWAYYRELYFFPPLVFLGSYLSLLRVFPPHPIQLFALLASSFMFTTLTILMLRPPKRVYLAHWVRLNVYSV